MPDIPDNIPENKKPAEGSRETVDQSSPRGGDQSGPLDGSTSGTIGGGGPETGGPTARPEPPEMPKPKPEDAASGRMAPDPLGAAMPEDPLKVGPTDTNRQN